MFFSSSFIGFSIDMTRTPSSQRYNFAIDVINEAGKIALSYFSNLSQLKVEKKGHQDLVSEADKNVEIFIRKQISKHKCQPFDGLSCQAWAQRRWTS